MKHLRAEFDKGEALKTNPLLVAKKPASRQQLLVSESEQSSGEDWDAEQKPVASPVSACAPSSPCASAGACACVYMSILCHLLMRQEMDSAQHANEIMS